VTQLFDRALDFQRETLELVADELRPIEEGWVVRCAGLRLVWSLNEVRVAREIGYTEAVKLVERHLGDLPYRQLVVEHQPSGELLEQPFREAGWRVDREVTMVLTRAPDSPSAGVDVIEPGEQEALALMRRWTSEDPDLKLSGEPLAQVVEACRRSWLARNATRLGVSGGDGSLAAMAMVYSGGEVAQVEDVYTVPEERRRGFARAAVARAASLAHSRGHELTFIVADDQDWPKHLYAELGFEPVGRVWVFHRELKSG
jgi:GNAT superfamily N-acetyltransferase